MDLLGELEPDSGIDSELRAFLLVHARAMERALADLPVRGRASLEDAFDRAWGAANRRADLTAQSDANRKVWKKFGDLLIAVAAVLQISTSSFVLPGQIRQAIEGPQPTQVEVVQQGPQTPAAPAASERSSSVSAQAEKDSAANH